MYVIFFYEDRKSSNSTESNMPLGGNAKTKRVKSYITRTYPFEETSFAQKLSHLYRTYKNKNICQRLTEPSVASLKYARDRM